MNFESLEQLEDAKAKLIEHPLFDRVQNFASMRVFMEAHVFAVWDFMCLLKTLQRQLTTVQLPWSPPKNREAARFINEIVLGEESDEVESGRFMSHFELYVQAMKECGASVVSIQAFNMALESGAGFEGGLSAANAPGFVREFVRSTMKFCAMRPHEVAAAFLYGREDIIPDMFTRILSDNKVTEDRAFRTLKLYLKRHIELDGESHGPRARAMMQSLCGHDSFKWRQALMVGGLALQARHRLWDAVLSSLPNDSTEKALREHVRLPLFMNESLAPPLR